MENSAYMESVAGDCAVLAYDHDEKAALDGAQLISAETDPDLQQEQDIFIFINGNFTAFLGYLRNLSLRDQELLLAYYCLRKTQTQTQLAPIFKTSQTLCSARMRAAVRAMCAFIAFVGQPTEERMRPILQAVGAEEASLSTGPKTQYKEEDGECLSQHGKHGKAAERATLSLARLLAEYAEARSFRTLADRHGIHRPEIRRAFRRAAERLEAGGREQQALAAWIRALIDKANPFGEGESKRQAAKRGDVFASDDERIADFRIRVEDGLLAKILAPRGNL